MPLIASSYIPPLPFKNGHFATIYSGLVRSVSRVAQERERIFLPDGDFMDLDWSYSSQKTDKLLILLHGLEGNSKRPYMLGSAKIFNQHGFDACAVNFRSCSGENNRLFRTYHSGASDDLEQVLNHVLSTKNYKKIVLKGFSLGGNVSLKYLGERSSIPKEIKAAIAVSAPCHLKGSMLKLHEWENYLYSLRFKKHLVEKLRWKQQQFPHLVSESDIKKVKLLRDFDDVYTSKAHGFENGLDYYEKCSSLQFLPSINLPSLILNAKNDSFLSAECYPIQASEENKNVFLETPAYGGHVGFYGKNNLYYNEKRALEFVKEMLS